VHYERRDIKKASYVVLGHVYLWLWSCVVFWVMTVCCVMVSKNVLLSGLCYYVLFLVLLRFCIFGYDNV